MFTQRTHSGITIILKCWGYISSQGRTLKITPHEAAHTLCFVVVTHHRKQLTRKLGNGICGRVGSVMAGDLDRESGKRCLDNSAIEPRGRSVANFTTCPFCGIFNIAEVPAGGI